MTIAQAHRWVKSLSGQLTAEQLEIAGEVLEDLSSQLQFMLNVGLHYLTLDGSARFLSGGEAQRIKLAKELSRVSSGDTVYLLDKPTTGLHVADIQSLLDVLHCRTDAGNVKCLVIGCPIPLSQVKCVSVDPNPTIGNQDELAATGRLTATRS
jgi:excinuclease ABC subunit A